MGIVGFACSAYLGHCLLRMPVFARMASSSFGFCEHHSWLARGQFSARTVFDVGGVGLPSRGIRRGIADGPHGPASAAHDNRSSFDLGGCARDAVVARFAAAIRASRCRSTVPLAAGAAGRAGTFATCVLLACRRHGIGRMACPLGVYTCVAIRKEAYGRARMIPCGGVSFFVARYPTPAGCSGVGAIVDPLVPFSPYPSLRPPF